MAKCLPSVRLETFSPKNGFSFYDKRCDASCRKYSMESNDVHKLNSIFFNDIQSNTFSVLTKTLFHLPNSPCSTSADTQMQRYQLFRWLRFLTCLTSFLPEVHLSFSHIRQSDQKRKSKTNKHTLLWCCLNDGIMSPLSVTFGISSLHSTYPRNVTYVWMCANHE